MPNDAVPRMRYDILYPSFFGENLSILTRFAWVEVVVPGCYYRVDVLPCFASFKYLLSRSRHSTRSKIYFACAIPFLYHRAFLVVFLFVINVIFSVCCSFNGTWLLGFQIICYIVNKESVVVFGKKVQYYYIVAFYFKYCVLKINHIWNLI